MDCQHARLPFPLLSPRVYSNSCPLSWWCYLTISSSVVPSPFAFTLSHNQGLFQWVVSFVPSGQCIGNSALTSVLPMSIQGWFPLGLTGLISLQSRGLSRVFSSTTIRKNQFFSAQPSLWSKFHFFTWLPEKIKLWLYGLLTVKWCLFFLILSRFVTAFLPRSKHFILHGCNHCLQSFWSPRK